MSVKQNKDQPIDEFIKYFKQLVASTSLKFPDPMLVELFRKSLYDIEAGFAILDARVTTLDDAINAVSTFEFIKELKRKERLESKQQDTHNSKSETSVDELAEQMKQLKIKILELTKPRIFPDDRFCTQCQQKGHFRSYCPQIECYTCKQKGHTSVKCPMKINDKLHNDNQQTLSPAISKSEK